MNRKGTWLVLASAILFSLGGVLIKSIPWSAMAISGARNVYAVIVILIYMAVTRHRFVWNKSVVFSGLMNMLTGISFVMATKLTTAANAIVLQFVEPAIVILLMWMLFHTIPHKDEVITCIVAFAGILCFFFDKLTMSGLIGNFLALFSGLCYAFVFMTKKMPGADLESSLLLSFLMGSIIGMPFVFQETDFRPSVLLAIAALGIFQFGLAFVLLYQGLKTVPPVTASLTSMIEPILNPLIVAIVCKEMLGPAALIGAVLVIGASTVYNVKKAREA